MALQSHIEKTIPTRKPYRIYIGVLNVHDGGDGILEIPAAPHFTPVPLIFRQFSQDNQPGNF
jgi:hypothetical protein